MEEEEGGGGRIRRGREGGKEIIPVVTHCRSGIGQNIDGKRAAWALKKMQIIWKSIIKQPQQQI